MVDKSRALLDRSIDEGSSVVVPERASHRRFWTSCKGLPQPPTTPRFGGRAGSRAICQAGCFPGTAHSAMQQYCSRVLANFCTVVLLYLASLTFVIGGGHADPPILCQRWCAYDCQSSGSAQASIQCLSNSLNCTWLAQDNANSCTLGVISKNFWVYIQISAFMRWCAACRYAELEQSLLRRGCYIQGV